MPYKSYLIEQFDTTHENIFFKEFSDKLSENFKNDNTLSVLIGNLNVNGNQLDALFIKNGQITVIDFKNYGGELKFSVNNHWSIKTKNDIVLVAGGSYNRNPFQQVNQYRRSLIEFLSSRNNTILKELQENINWGHISSLVLFHQPIEFDKKQIPSNLVYFHISDYQNSIQLLNQIKSNKLNLSDTEINQILQELNISNENLFDESKIVSDKGKYEEKIKFDLIKRLVKKEPHKADEIDRILAYYRILLDIESYREENKLQNTFTVTTNSNFTNEKIIIDYTQKAEVLKALSNNKNERFPKNIFIGVNFTIGGLTEKRMLLYQIVLSSEINYAENKNIIEASNFELYSPVFHQLNLSKNQIDELNNKISQFNNLDEKINFLQKELEILDIQITGDFALALSDKNLTNSQLSSELNRLRRNHIANLQYGIINNYLFNRPIVNTSEKTKPLIKISQLNKSQEEAVKASIQNDLTVITGPPGTGKTQVVLNIIANAIINDKKVLFASKNNKAVDNVTERFISNYLLRVGAGKINDLKDKLNNFTATNYNYDKTIEISNQKIDEIRLRIDEINTFFKNIKSLPKEIENHKNNIEELKFELETYISKINTNEKRLFFDNNYSFELNKNNINLLLHDLQKKNSNFITKFFFKLFSQTKKLQEIVGIENNIEKDITDYVNTLSPLFDNEKTDLQTIINHLNELIKLYDNFNKHNSFKSKNNEKTNYQKNSLTEKTNKLNWIIDNENSLKLELAQKNIDFIDKGGKFVKQYINNKLSNTSSGVISNFKSYLENAPWRDNEYFDYENSCEMFLNKFLAVSVTNLSVKKAFSLTKEIFDILVIDEASQCDIASAIPLIFRAKKIVIIGDPHQLRHITSVKKQYEENYILNYLNLSETKYNYEKNSLFDYVKTIAEKSNIPTYFLKEHYRCHPKIIDFSNVFFYHNELIINTEDENFKFGDKGIVWCNVKGKISKERNFNKAEKDYVIKLGQELLNKYPKAKIGITTPFRHQNKALELEKAKLDNINKNAEIKTIHKFQGDEKDIIILSLVVTSDAKSSLTAFINTWSKYLLNVAITRAKSTLYIVGDFDFCKNDKRNEQKPLSQLAEYVETNGIIKNITTK